MINLYSRGFVRRGGVRCKLGIAMVREGKVWN